MNIEKHYLIAILLTRLEATLGVIESARTGKLIEMKHQVPVSPEYGDAKIFDLPPAEAGVLVT